MAVKSKSRSGLKLVSDSTTDHLIFFGDFSTYAFKYVNETSHDANNIYFGHNEDNERQFHSEFHSRVKFRSKFA